ncbi:GTPase Era, mitochondrial [Pseudophryne corroboree]|uniref:GTPase Era, mitochondrial n=1 Tax=Pseudophryne corroboree TaxID=495146 RepID=UPI003081BAA4
MWGAALRSVRVEAARSLAGRRAASVILLRKQDPHRTNTLAACLYAKDSVIGKLLGASQDLPANDCLAQQVPAVSFNKDERDSLLKQVPDLPESPKILKIAIIGAPNVGKSTLSNQLLGRKVFPVSSKVHTTRCKAHGILTEGDTQLILLDTPGMVSAERAKRHHLEKSLQVDPWESMKLADVVVVLVDVSDKWMRKSLHLEVLACLSQYSHIPSILVLNKIDLLKQKSLLLEITGKLTEGLVNGKKAMVKSLNPSGKKDKTDHLFRNEENDPLLKIEENTTHQKSRENLEMDIERDRLSGVTTVPSSGQGLPHKDLNNRTGWPYFQEVFMMSAINGEEIETLKKYLMSLAKPGDWEFHSEVVTTQSPQEICNNVIREKLLEYLPKEIPYNITQITEFWEEGSGGELVIKQTLLVPKENHVKLVIGAGGELIGRIANEAGRDLMDVFFCDVQLRLSVKFKK